MAEDPSHSRPQSNEIRLRLSDGHNWGAPIELTHDTRPDFNPQAAFDAQGHVVVAWLQNRLDNLPADSTLDDNFLQNLEIAYAVVDAKTGSLVSTGQLTKDSVLDFDPHLAAARDGTVWLAWQASPGLNAIGSAAAPNQLRAAAWDGKQWSAVETVTDKLANTLWWSLAAQDKQNALVAADTAAASSGSRDILIYQRAVGGWAPARQLTHGGADNIGPRAAYTPEGRPVLAWYSDQSIRGLAGDLNSAPSIWFTTTVDSGAALGAGSLLAGAGGQLALVWPGSAPNGPDVWLAHYDPATQVWAGPAPVFGDSSQEADLSAAVREDGTLLLGLARVATTTESVTVPGGAAIDVPASGPTASLVVAEVPGVFETAGSPAQASANGLTWLFLAGLVVVAILVLGGVGLVFVLRRRS